MKTATDALVKAVKSGSAKRIEAAQRKLDAEADRLARADARTRRLAAAQDIVTAERIATAERDRAASADRAEAELREQGEPYCEIHFGGKSILVDLSRTEMVAAGVATEAVRRICAVLRQVWREQIIATREAGRVVPAREFLSVMESSEAGLLFAHRHGLVAVKSEQVEEPIVPVEHAASVEAPVEHVEVVK